MRREEQLRRAAKEEARRKRREREARCVFGFLAVVVLAGGFGFIAAFILHT